MRAWLAHAGLAGGSIAVAVGALLFLHLELRPAQAALCGGIGWLGAVILRRAWATLPRFVTGWLDAGVATVITLVGAMATVSGDGLAYVALRGPELVVTGSTAGLLGTAVTALAYTHHRLAAEVATQEKRVARLQQRALQSHLAALSAQINPHFLFNTLNTLAEVVHEDADLAEDLITDLAAMMRYAPRSSHGWVELGEELDVIRRLLRLAEARLGERLQWSVTATEEARAVKVPGLLVQPLVENAIKYAAAARAEGGRVHVAAVVSSTDRGDRLHVVVADDGPGLPATIASALHEPGRGTGGAGGGLYHTAERTRLAWGEATAGLRIEPTDSGEATTGTRLVLDVPTQMPPETHTESVP